MALSDADALEEKNWRAVPPMKDFCYSFSPYGSMAHVERFRPE